MIYMMTLTKCPFFRIHKRVNVCRDRFLAIVEKFISLVNDPKFTTSPPRVDPKS